MTILHINILGHFQTVEFPEKFITTLKRLVNGYEEVRIVFDNYHEVSLKNHTRDGRGKVNHSRQFVIEDRTIIGMGLLSDIKTKHDITIYLSNKCHTLFKKPGGFLSCFRQ